MRLKRGSLLFLGLLLLTPGCTSMNSVGKNLQVTNRPGYFELHWERLETHSTELSYDWPSAGSSVALQQTSRIEGGTATLEIRDASGAVVHTEDLKREGSLTTLSGKSGAWRVSLRLRSVTGTIGLRLQGA